MNNGETLAVLDIGSSKIKAIIGHIEPAEASYEKPKISILGVGVAKSEGIRKGVILDMKEFQKNADKAFEEAENMAGQQIAPPTYVCFSSMNMEIFSTNGVVSIPGDEITDEDVSRVLEVATASIPLTNKTLLQVLPQVFSVDMQNNVKTPQGMQAKKLDVHATVFTAQSNITTNIDKGLSDIAIDIEKIYPSVLSAAESVLTKRQKELGVVCIDIGSSTTNLAVYEEGILLHAAVLPIGGEHVTSDLSLGLRVSTDVAEKIKIEHADLGIQKGKKQEIDLSKYDKNETEKVGLDFISEIVTARYQELLLMVNQELKYAGRDGMLPEGVVFTGGGSKMKGLVELAKKDLRLPATVGTPEEHEYMTGTSVADPIFASAVGALLLAQREAKKNKGFKLNISVPKIFASLNAFIKKLLP